MPSSIMINAPAKVNLTLDVKYKRQDGYHEIESVMHQVNLCDQLILEKSRKTSIASNSKLIPQDENNLAYKASRALLDKYGIKEGVRIFIEKNIPVEAGLAGGSSNAAAVLEGVNRLYALGADQNMLKKIGSHLGSDIPFCLQGGTALATGRGELLQGLNPGPCLTMVLVKPTFSLSTAEVYRGLDLDGFNERPDTRAFIEAWDDHDLKAIANNMINVMESYSIRKYPEISHLKDEMIEKGAMAAVMSGSGPTVLGLFNNGEQARKTFNSLRERYQEAFLVSSYDRSDL